MSNLVVGKTYKFKGTISKDGVPWDLTSATVVLILKNPSGAETSHAASAVNAVLGIMQYVTTTSDLSVAGTWHRCWNVVDGTINVRSESVPFQVVNSP